MVRAKLAYQRLLEQHADSPFCVQARMGLGRIALHQQLVEAALGHFQEVAARHPQSAAAQEARLLEAFCHVRLKRFHEALESLAAFGDRREDDGPAVATAGFYRGEALSGLGRYDEAVKAYEQALAQVTPVTVERSPEPMAEWIPSAQFGLGWALYQTHRCHDGLKALESYLSGTGAQPNRIEAWFARGRCLEQIGHPEEARPWFERIVSKDPAHAVALEGGLSLMEAYRAQGRFEEAKRLAGELMTHHPDPRSRAHLQLPLGAIALDEGHPAEAKTLFELAARSDDPAARQAALSGLGDVQEFLGDAEAARRWYHEAIGVDATSVPASYATYRLGRLDLQQGRWEEAAAVFETLSRHPDAAFAAEARLSLAAAYLTLDRDEQARELLETARRRAPEDPIVGRAAYYLAWHALKAGDEPAARQWCQEAMSRSPRSEEALEAQMMLLDLEGAERPVSEAAAQLERMVATEPSSSRRRGALAKRLGDLARTQRLYPRAIEWYERALEWWPALQGEATYWLASCYEAAGHVEEALQRYQEIAHPPWRTRGLLAAAKLLERQDQLLKAKAIYERLAGENIPEAKIVRERLTTVSHQPSAISSQQ
jgi:tetratricopeptide (TPR) repeat protein